jgi:hypothetical protein
MLEACLGKVRGAKTAPANDKRGSLDEVASKIDLIERHAINSCSFGCVVGPTYVPGFDVGEGEIPMPSSAHAHDEQYRHPPQTTANQYVGRRMANHICTHTDTIVSCNLGSHVYMKVFAQELVVKGQQYRKGRRYAHPNAWL